MITHRAQPTLDVQPIRLLQRPIIAADALAFYLGKLLWPMPLAVDYGRSPARVLHSAAAYWTWLIPVLVTAAVVLSRRRIMMCAWLIFIFAAGANLGLMRFEFQLFSTVADHYVYLSLLGVALAVGYVASIAPLRGRIVIAACLVACSIVSFHAAGVWRDSFALWRQVLSVNPTSGLAAGNLGSALLESGDIPGAMAWLHRAREVDPNDVFARMNLSRALLLSGDTAAAAQSEIDMVQIYRQRADFNPQLSAALLEKFAREMSRRGDEASARRLLDEAQRLNAPAAAAAAATRP
jgi:tetratricopeptide (TPR) repeat protein